MLSSLTISLTISLNILLILSILLLILIFPLYFIHPIYTSLFNISQFIPTISLAGGLQPESIIFTLFMHLISTAVLPLYIAIYYTTKEKINSISINSNNIIYINILNTINNIYIWLGIIATISMYLTGSIR